MKQLKKPRMPLLGFLFSSCGMGIMFQSCDLSLTKGDLIVLLESTHSIPVWYDKLDLRIGESVPGRYHSAACSQGTL